MHQDGGINDFAGKRIVLGGRLSRLCVSAPLRFVEKFDHVRLSNGRLITH
jgi:hypothetical protein